MKGDIMKAASGAYLALCLFLVCVPGQGQVDQDEQRRPGSVPIYRVTVIGRTIQAINYGHRSVPTKIDFPCFSFKTSNRL